MYEANDSVEESPVYQKGDIVWVKLSSYWWPGEVKNEEDLPSDLLADFKKRPKVIVKFFNEDSYEYINKWINIHPYNCEKKGDFIKKGMAKYRLKLSHMAKFPKDIGIAEEKTNGDPNILSQPEFLPAKKIDLNEVFGTPSPKKSTKTASSTAKKVPKEINQPLITHRRFLGNDNYQAQILHQYPGKDRIPDSDDEEIKKIYEGPQTILSCQSCSFQTKRLGVLLIHSKSHLDGSYAAAKRKSKIAEYDFIESDSEAKGTISKPKQIRKKKVKKVENKPLDVFTNLLEEWNVSDEEMEGKEPLEKDKSKKHDVKASIKENSLKKDEDQTTNNHTAVTDSPKPSPQKNTHDDIKNCFDFDEEDEEDDFLFPVTDGRKIPRVIPEKPRASLSEFMELTEEDKELETEKSSEDKEEFETETPEKSTLIPETEPDLKKKEILRVSQSFNRAQAVDESIENTFKEIMEETEVPMLDDLGQTLKPEQNFHDARTVKFPDKGGTTIVKGITNSPKSGTSKKRFVTSFDDFQAGFRKVDNEKQIKQEKKSCEESLSKNKSTLEKSESDDLTTELKNNETSFRISILSDDTTTNTDFTVTVEVDNDKMPSCRSTMQPVVKDNFEEIIEIDLGVEMEAFKKDLETEQKLDTEEKNNQQEISLEQLTRDLEGSSDVEQNEDQKKNIQKSKKIDDEDKNLQEELASKTDLEQPKFGGQQARSATFQPEIAEPSQLEEVKHVDNDTEHKKPNSNKNKKEKHLDYEVTVTSQTDKPQEDDNSTILEQAQVVRKKGRPKRVVDNHVEEILNESVDITPPDTPRRGRSKKREENISKEVPKVDSNESHKKEIAHKSRNSRSRKLETKHEESVLECQKHLEDDVNEETTKELPIVHEAKIDETIVEVTNEIAEDVVEKSLKKRRIGEQSPKEIEIPDLIRRVSLRRHTRHEMTEVLEAKNEILNQESVDVPVSTPRKTKTKKQKYETSISDNKVDEKALIDSNKETIKTSDESGVKISSQKHSKVEENLQILGEKIEKVGDVSESKSKSTRQTESDDDLSTTRRTRRQSKMNKSKSVEPRSELEVIEGSNIAIGQENTVEEAESVSHEKESALDNMENENLTGKRLEGESVTATNEVPETLTDIQGYSIEAPVEPESEKPLSISKSNKSRKRVDVEKDTFIEKTQISEEPSSLQSSMVKNTGSFTPKARRGRLRKSSNIEDTILSSKETEEASEVKKLETKDDVAKPVQSSENKNLKNLSSETIKNTVSETVIHEKSSPRRRRGKTRWDTEEIAPSTKTNIEEKPSEVLPVSMNVNTVEDIIETSLEPVTPASKVETSIIPNQRQTRSKMSVEKKNKDSEVVELPKDLQNQQFEDSLNQQQTSTETCKESKLVTTDLPAEVNIENENTEKPKDFNHSQRRGRSRNKKEETFLENEIVERKDKVDEVVREETSNKPDLEKSIEEPKFHARRGRSAKLHKEATDIEKAETSILKNVETNQKRGKKHTEIDITSIPLPNPDISVLKIEEAISEDITSSTSKSKKDKKRKSINDVTESEAQVLKDEGRRLRSSRRDKLSLKPEEDSTRVPHATADIDIDISEIEQDDSSKSETLEEDGKILTSKRSGIVSDTHYGRKPKEVRTGKTRTSKSRWDVVSLSEESGFCKDMVKVNAHEVELSKKGAVEDTLQNQALAPESLEMQDTQLQKEEKQDNVFYLESKEDASDILEPSKIVSGVEESKDKTVINVDNLVSSETVTMAPIQEILEQNNESIIEPKLLSEIPLPPEPKPMKPIEETPVQSVEKLKPKKRRGGRRRKGSLKKNNSINLDNSVFTEPIIGPEEVLESIPLPPDNDKCTGIDKLEDIPLPSSLPSKSDDISEAQEISLEVPIMGIVPEVESTITVIDQSEQTSSDQEIILEKSEGATSNDVITEPIAETVQSDKVSQELIAEQVFKTAAEKSQETVKGTDKNQVPLIESQFEKIEKISKDTQIIQDVASEMVLEQTLEIEKEISVAEVAKARQLPSKASSKNVKINQSIVIQDIESDTSKMEIQQNMEQTIEIETCVETVEQEVKQATEHEVLELKTQTTEEVISDTLEECKKQTVIESEEIKDDSSLKTTITLEKRGRGRPRKYSKTEDITSSEPIKSVVEPKSVPLKKNRWPRRSSHTKNDFDVESTGAKIEPLENIVIEKTEKSSLDANTPDNEIILPPKKSKRASEASLQQYNFSQDHISPEKKSDGDTLTFPACDDSLMSTSLRNNIEGLIKEIDTSATTASLSSSDVKSEIKTDNFSSTDDIAKCVPPKKKKIEDSVKTEQSNMPQAPKKKMQKLFENSQIIEKSTTELPLMSPLAKKKSFLFQQEEEAKTESKNIVEDTKNEINVDEFLNISTIRKKRKSSCEDYPSKKEKIEETEQEASNKNKDTADLSTKNEVKSENLSIIESDIDIKNEEIIVPTLNEAELVPISVTPTVMSEKDLADAQVEITQTKVISEKKGKITLESGVKKVDDKKILKTCGTEFTSKAMLKDFDNSHPLLRSSAYALKSELLDILEGNSNSSTNSSGSEQKFKTSFDNYDKKTVVQGIIDFEEAIPSSQIVLTSKVNVSESVIMDSPKLLERLSMTSEPKPKTKKVLVQSDAQTPEKPVMAKLVAKPMGIPKPGQKIVIKTGKHGTIIPKITSSKPIILSEQIIRPASSSTPTPKLPLQPQGIKRQYEDIEDVETAFIIPKISKKAEEIEEEDTPKPPEKPSRSRGSKNSGKAKILQQTIITPKGEIIPQTATTTATTSTQLQQPILQPAQDDSMFDISNMPIVLSEDLSAECIQNMPVVLSENILPPTSEAPAAPAALPPKSQDKLLAALSKKLIPGVGTKQIIFKTTQAAAVTSLPVKPAAKSRILQNAAALQGKIPKIGTPALLATGTTPDGKQAKYVLVPPAGTVPAVPQLKSVKQTIVKKQAVVHQKVTTPSGIVPAQEQPIGNKIMIVTNAQGQQTRVVLTPQQQKALMQAQAQSGSKKTLIKGAIPKALLESATAGPSGIVVPKTVPNVPVATPPTVTTHTGLLMPVTKIVKTPSTPKKTTPRTTKQQKTILIKNQLGQTVRRIQGTDDADLDRQVAEQLEAIKATARLQQAYKSQETISNANKQTPNSTISTSSPIKQASRRVCKKVEQTPKLKMPSLATTVQVETQKTETTGMVPALAPLSPRIQATPKPTFTRKVESLSPASFLTKTPETRQTTLPSIKTEVKEEPTPIAKDIKRSESPVQQVVIQDSLGNLTTVTVGQILALPNDTVDGQPQTYVLFRVDEKGTLQPLNNDALMSLDPSLGLGADINNVILQVDHDQGTVSAMKPPELPQIPVKEEKIEQKPKPVKEETQLIIKQEHQSVKQELPLVQHLQPLKEEKIVPPEPLRPQETSIAVEQQIVIGEGVLPGDSGGQQLIVTGDQVATQKFIESLSDGTIDLANILANAEGGSVLVQTDGQQILIRTNNAAQAMMGLTESTEGGGNPMFATHKPNQDILAAALADTDVFQPTIEVPRKCKGQFSPPGGVGSPGGGPGLYPMNVGNVLETSLTLNAPIMTPLEVPSNNSKKIDDEADILNQVPKNVDLPITITDPNIAQTVAHQQALGLMELSLPIPEGGPSADMNSPSYSYSLPTLDDSVGMQKSFSSSMPLLTEDVVESENSVSSDRIRVSKDLGTVPSSFSPNFGSLPMLSEAIESAREEIVKTTTFGDIGSMPLLTDDVIDDSGSSSGSSKPIRTSPKRIERDIIDEGLSTLGGKIHCSLSEPPPDMFDLSALSAPQKEEEISSDVSSIPEPETLSLNSENSGDIPIQPPIVARLSDLKRPEDDSDGSGSDDKRARFD